MLIVFLLFSLLFAILSFAAGLVSAIWMAVPVFFLSYLALLLLWAAGGVIASLFVDIHTECDRDSPLFRFYANGIVDLLTCALRIRVQVSGMEKVPASGFLFVCNHRSAFDPILEMGIFRKYRLGFVSKKENFQIPVIGKIMHRCSCIALDRENPRKAIETITHAVRTIRSGSAVMGIYPEGTRNPDPESGLLPFKPGAFKIAQKAGCPIVVAVIRNTESVLKNAPFRKTRVQMKIVGVLDEDTVKRSSTVRISEMVRGMMEQGLFTPSPA
ncbi:MAG: lysophospholipid acyltransferase family protein [Oscillospiraceae bacterium]